MCETVYNFFGTDNSWIKCINSYIYIYLFIFYGLHACKSTNYRLKQKKIFHTEDTEKYLHYCILKYIVYCYITRYYRILFGQYNI